MAGACGGGAAAGLRSPRQHRAHERLRSMARRGRLKMKGLWNLGRYNAVNTGTARDGDLLVERSPGGSSAARARLTKRTPPRTIPIKAGSVYVTSSPHRPPPSPTSVVGSTSSHSSLAGPSVRV
eukprot:5384027-Prymnesium_polylepis.1